MGEIAEAMLDGTLCQWCGVFLDRTRDGIPQTCRACKRDGMDEVANTDYPKRDQPKRPKKRKRPARGR